MKKKLFWLVSRTAFGLYKWFPIFGELRASAAVIERDGRYLVIERNDGRGYSFPGGMAKPFEPDAQTLVREVREETGLTTVSHEFIFRYRTTADTPCMISVFRVEAQGTLAESWEGTPVWASLPDLRERAARSQRPIVDRLASSLEDRTKPSNPG